MQGFKNKTIDLNLKSLLSLNTKNFQPDNKLGGLVNSEEEYVTH